MFTSFKSRMAHVPSIFLLGFTSGLPFYLILSTLNVWMVEVGISKTSIGLLAWATLPYALKFLWAPLVDTIEIPLLTARLGQRRSWLLCSQIFMIICLIGLGYSSPAINLLETAIWALLVGICSATQDIAYEAYRVEVISTKNLGYTVSSSALGFRVGMLVAGAAPLYLSSIYSWKIAYMIMATCVFIGSIAVMFSAEPTITSTARKKEYIGFSSMLNKTLIAPVKSFLFNANWKVILPFILCFKVADTTLNSMSIPFLMETGFSKIEIANVAKTFGITAMILGVTIGGIILNYYSLKRCLACCTILQIFAALLFVWQAKIGYNLSLLFITMGFENVVCGMAQVMLIAYFSKLCALPYTATHYALLSSFASFVRVNLTSISGALADKVAWIDFYIIVCLCCIPSLILLYCFSRHFSDIEDSVPVS